MAHLRRIGAGLLAAALLVAAGLTAALARLNPALSARDCLAIVGDLWVLGVVMLSAPVIASSVLTFRHTRSIADVMRTGAVALFALLWFARLEPAHQIVSIRPHLSRWGVAQLLFIALSSAAAIAWPARRGRASARWAGTAAVIAGASLVLSLVASAIEPATDRDRAIAPIVARYMPSAGRGAASGRVLVVGIDGLEWRSAGWMMERGWMPVLQRLMREGRFFQQDNERLGFSAAIWTAIFTGRRPADTNVDDFVKWQFAGSSAAVTFLPRVGMHGVFFLDEFLKRTTGLGLWTDVPTDSIDSPAPPVWTIASQAGKKVGVFAPLPYSTTPERVNGFFVDAGDDRHFGVFYGDGRAAEDLQTSAGTGEFHDARESARLAASLFSRERPDLGVFYTHFVDTTQHEAWDFRLERKFFGGDPSIELDNRFDATPIRRAYDTADEMLGVLVDSFGSDATVIVVSDHGWRYDDYEHFRSPNGMLVVSPAAQHGYGGVAGVYTIAPMILSLLAVPVDARTAVVPREFLQPLHPDAEWQRRLRSLGYIGGAPPPIKRP